jgi:hypothetical protein
MPTSTSIPIPAFPSALGVVGIDGAVGAVGVLFKCVVF